MAPGTAHSPDNRVLIDWAAAFLLSPCLSSIPVWSRAGRK